MRRTGVIVLATACAPASVDPPASGSDGASTGSSGPSSSSDPGGSSTAVEDESSSGTPSADSSSGDAPACGPVSSPELSSASLEAGELVLHGCGFGSKAHAAPQHFEAFDGAAVGATPASLGYHEYGGFGGTVTVDDAVAASGARSLLHRTGHGTPDGDGVRESFPHVAIHGFASDELYVTYRLRVSTHGIGRVRQLKFNRGGHEVPGANGSPCYGAMPKFYESYYPTDATTTAALSALQGGIVRSDGSVHEEWIGESFGAEPPAVIEQDTWVQVEAYYRLDAPGQADGEYVTFVDGHRNFDLHGLELRGDASTQLDCSYLVIGIDYYVDVARSDGLSIWYDDHWLDDTRARVVLADAPTFEAARIRSPQPAASWDDATIVAGVHPTGFAVGAQAWAFVVTADGQVSNGVSVTID